MSNGRKLPRSTHGAGRRNEWLAIIYISPEVVQLLADPDDDRELAQARVNHALRPIFDRHYEANWPNAGAQPYVSVYKTQVNGEGPAVNIEMRTWPGERTEVSLTRESPRERVRGISADRIVTPPGQ